MSSDERIEIRIVSEDQILVNRTSVARETLGSTLSPMLETSTHGIVVVACDDRVSHGTFVNILDRVKLSGARQIAVTGD